MWLINIEYMKLEELTPPDSPAYAISSYTWEDDEVTFQEYRNVDIDKHGCLKIQKAYQLAQSKGDKYVWVDT